MARASSSGGASLGAQASACRGNDGLHTCRLKPALPGGSVRGFTLIELLVVLGILMLLMGITVAAIVSRPRIDAMIGAEQALSGAIRQARHTARSTGQPVVLRLKKAERQIAGLLREPIWHRLESWPQSEDAAGVLASWPGRTGTGLQIPEAFTRSGLLDPSLFLLPFTDLSPDDGLPLAGGRRLWRGSTGGNRPPLMLSVSVLPPIAGGAGVPNILPLVLVGDDKLPTDADFASQEQSRFGMLLINTAFAGTVTGVAPSWEVLGWFGADAAGRVEVSSIQDIPSGIFPDQGPITLLAGATDNFSGFSESGPLTGSRWTELTLLFDGTRLMLYRDGRRVGEKAVPVATTFTEALPQRVYVGLAEIATAVPTRQYASGATIDDVRLERLGDALAGNLPNGVQLSADYTITCHPDGRVEGVAAGDTTITLTSTSGPGATLTVETTGAVKLSQVTP